MALLKIVTAPDPRLRIKAKPVDGVDNSIRQLMDDMLETMYTNNGLGLAATQVGVDKRVIVMDCALEGAGPEPLKMANPEIIWQSEETQINTEGCLSVPDQRGNVERCEQVRVKYLDENGKQCELEASELLGICVQHEIDHLNGILYIDHLSKLKKDIILKKLKRLKAETSL